MKLELLYQLHERQCNIIDMLKKCDKRIKDWKEDAEKMHYKIVFGLGWMEAKIQKYEAIKQRLISYYKDIQIRIMMLQPEIELNTTSEMDMATILS